MPLHIRHEMAVEVKHLGVLALAAMGFEVGIKNESTTVYFVLQSKIDAGLFSYILAGPTLREPNSLLFDFFENDRKWVESPTNPDTYLLFFEREVDGELREPNKFLHATANKLLAELRAIEELHLSTQELEDEVIWARDNYGSRQPMPNFKRPRHTD